MNAQQQPVRQQELEEYEDYEDCQAEERCQLHAQLVKAQHVYWDYVTLLDDRAETQPELGQYIIAVENLRPEDVAQFPDRAEWLAEIQAQASWAQEIQRLEALLGLDVSEKWHRDSKIVSLWP